MMIKKMSIFVLNLSLFVFCGIGYTQDMEIGGVKFTEEKVVAGKNLKLNGVALKKAAMVIKVYAKSSF